MSFDIAIERVLGHEGGYAHRSYQDDPGGETNWGITIATARANGYHGDMKTMNRNEAIVIYKRAIWDRNLLGQMDFAVAFQVFDGIVNHGAGNAVKWLQEAVGTTKDGAIGQKTIAATNAADPVRTIFKFNAERLVFYTHLSNWDANSRGWTRRVAGNLFYAQQDLM